jgi:hypothetical protein
MANPTNPQQPQQPAQGSSIASLAPVANPQPTQAPVVAQQPAQPQAQPQQPAQATATGKGTGKATGKATAAQPQATVRGVTTKAQPLKPLAASKAPKTIANPTMGTLAKQGQAHYVTKNGQVYRIAAQPAVPVGYNPATATPRQKRVWAQAHYTLAQWQAYCIGKHIAKQKRQA